LLLVVAIATIGVGVGIYFHRRLGKQPQPDNNSNPTTTATRQRQQPDTDNNSATKTTQQRQLLQSERNTTGTENEQQSDDGYVLPLNANVPGHHVAPVNEYTDLTVEGSDLSTPTIQQNQNPERDYKLPLHEYGNVACDDHAYDRVSRSNEATYEEI
jgi:hypothetical protein